MRLANVQHTWIVAEAFSMRRLIASIALLTFFVAAAVSLACGSDDKKGETSSSSSIPEQKIVARDFAYDFPDSVKGGFVELSLTNTGKEDHQAQIFRLKDGVSQQQFQQQFLTALQDPDPSGLFALGTFGGGPNVIEPGKSQSVFENLSAGQYAFLCYIEGADGVPHFAKGMVKNFTVTAPDAKQPEPPKAGAKAIAADFNFLGLETLPAGKSMLEFTNGGPQPHELTILKLEGVTADQLKAVFTGAAPEPPPGPPPYKFAGGFGAQPAGATGYAEVDLPAGNYAFICFVPDAKTGAPHAALGMVKGFMAK